MALILGIETSCDETGAAVVEDGTRVHSNVVWSQHELHERYRGVVPEIASRAHIERIMPVIHEALTKADCRLTDLDAIAVGNRPGLIGSLIVGVSAAKALAWSLQLPLIGVDHVQAHLHAASLRLIGSEPTPTPDPRPEYPALGLVVSGGHSSLYRLDSPTQLTRLGRTIDDAVGEAYDKAAVILDVPYPGGPNLDKLARSEDADPSRFDLPRSMLGPDSLDFSFSGLKTALLYAVRGHPVKRGDGSSFQRSVADLSPDDRRDLAAAFQHAAIDALLLKIERAIQQAAADPVRCVVIGGGVSANSLLRQRAAKFAAQHGIPVHIPAMAFCLDNAAMIAGLATCHLAEGRTDDLDLPAIATTGS
jgi:N6-L-threonylcarbamoyladenine synthase